MEDDEQTMTVSREASMQMPEDQLVARCRAGDLDAFGLVYVRYERQVFRYAYHLLGHREDADDVKQETFLKAHRAIGGFRSDSSLQTWLLKICGNLCRDRIKSWENRKVIYDSRVKRDCPDEEGAQDPVAALERSQTKETILRALQGMPAGQREVVVLHDVEELNYEEIAAILGCSSASAKLRVFRARRALKERVTALLK